MSGTQNDPQSEQSVPDGQLVSEVAINAEEYPDLATLVTFGLDDDVDGYLRAIGIDEDTIVGDDGDEDEDETTTLTAEAAEFDAADDSTLSDDDDDDDDVSET